MSARGALILTALAVIIVAAAVVVNALGAAALREVPVKHPLAGANPDHGRELLGSYGCGSCHTIPGVTAARGKVGPPLVGLDDRAYIAGELTNDGDNLARWIHDPQGVEPGVAMPDLGVGMDSARDIAAYLYTLR